MMPMKIKNRRGIMTHRRKEKKFGVGLIVLASLLFAAAPVSAQVNRDDEAVVLKFYQAAINDKDFAEAAKFLGPVYRQHNPRAGDGAEGLKAFIAHLKQDVPTYHSEVKRVFSDRGHVILHVHNRATPDSRGAAIIDIFRLEHGKIVEHWDVRQDIPESTASGNPVL